MIDPERLNEAGRRAGLTAPKRYLCSLCRELQELLDGIAYTVQCRTCPNRICDHVAQLHAGRCRACREAQP